jgi:hypothetical protein
MQSFLIFSALLCLSGEVFYRSRQITRQKFHAAGFGFEEVLHFEKNMPFIRIKLEINFFAKGEQLVTRTKRIHRRAARIETATDNLDWRCDPVKKEVSTTGLSR